MPDPLRSPPLKLSAIVVVLAAGVFACDLLTPLGSVEWLLYLLPLSLLYRHSGARTLVPAAGAFTVLIILGGIFSPRGIATEIAVFNRSLGILVLWAITLLLLYRTRHQDSVRHRSCRVSDTVAPIRYYGEEIAAYVAPRDSANPPSEAALLEYCRSRLPFFKRPKVILFGQDVPYTATGKPKRLELKASLAEPLASYRDVQFKETA